MPSRGRFEKLQGQPLTLNPRDRTLELISDPQAWPERERDPDPQMLHYNL